MASDYGVPEVRAAIVANETNPSENAGSFGLDYNQSGMYEDVFLDTIGNNYVSLFSLQHKINILRL